MLPETSILYVIRHASVILIVGFQQLRRVPTREICWKKNSGTQGLEPATFGSTSKCFPELLWLIEWDFTLIYTVQRCI